MRKSGARTGLLLGAGFSQPAGMPLVRDLTSLLFMKAMSRLIQDVPRCLLSDRGLKQFAEIVIGLSPATNYEAFVGQLEDDCLSALDEANITQLAVATAERFGFLELIYEVMLECEEQALDTAGRADPLFRGLRELASQSRPLWVFSLNHDVVLEKLAASWRIPLAMPELRLQPDSRIQALLGRIFPPALSTVITVSRALGDTSEPLRLFDEGSFGINLVKLHGSLNQFIDVTDVNDPRIVQISPPLVRSEWDALHTLLNGLLWEDDTSAALNHRHMNVDEERTRVRNTILSGSHKFTEHSGVLHNPITAPLAFVIKHSKGAAIAYREADDYKTTLGDDFLASQFRIFSDSISQLTRLVAIGYSLGDVHVNSVIKAWLTADVGRTLEVVGPGALGLAPRLGPEFQAFIDAGRVEFTDADTLTYFSRYAEAPQHEWGAHAEALAALLARRVEIAEIAARLARKVVDHPERTSEEAFEHWREHGASYDLQDMLRMTDAGQNYPKPPDE